MDADWPVESEPGPVDRSLSSLFDPSSLARIVSQRRAVKRSKIEVYSRNRCTYAGWIRTSDQAIMSRQIKALFSQREMDDQDDLE